MTFLMRFFASNADLAAELARDEPLLQLSLDRYFDAYKTKQDALSKLQAGFSMREMLPTFHLALADECAFIAGSEKTETEIINEISSFRIKQHTAELDKLNLTLNHAASREHYVYSLMQKLHDILQSQAQSVAALQNDPENTTLREALITQLGLETRIVDEIRKIDNFHQFYQDLALGERRKHELAETEREFAEQVYLRMMEAKTEADGSFAMGHKNQDSVAFLTEHCFDKLEEEAIRSINQGMLTQHSYVIYELVNSDLFEKFVVEEINAFGLQEFNDKNMIHHFINIFRELYNTRIESDMY